MSKPFKIFLIILILFLTMFSIWHFNLRIGLADHYFLKTKYFNNWEDSLKAYKKVFKYFPKEPYYNKKFALDLLWSIDKFYSSKETKIKILDLAIKRIESIPKKERVFEAITYLSRLYAKKANFTNDQDDFDMAEKYIKKASEISPKMAGVYNDWCQIKIYKKEWDNALEKCQKALSLYPSLSSDKLNYDHRKMVKAEMSQVYEKLGIIFREKEQYEVAEKMYSQVLKFFPLQKKYIWKKIADLYYIQGNLNRAIKNNFHGTIINPNDPVWPKALAILYKEKGELEKSQFWSQRAKELEQQ